MRNISDLLRLILGRGPVAIHKRPRRIAPACNGYQPTRTLQTILTMTNEQVAELRDQGLTPGEIEAIEVGVGAMERRHTAAIEARRGVAHAERVEAHRESLRWSRSHGDDR